MVKHLEARLSINDSKTLPYNVTRFIKSVGGWLNNGNYMSSSEKLFISIDPSLRK